MWVIILLSIKLTRDNHVYWTRLSRYFHNSRWTKCLVFPQMATFFTVTYCCQWAINKKTLKSRRYEILDSLINGRAKKHTNHLSCLKSIPHALRNNCKREIVLTTGHEKVPIFANNIPRQIWSLQTKLAKKLSSISNSTESFTLLLHFTNIDIIWKFVLFFFSSQIP